jgi:hypothetical protein
MEVLIKTHILANYNKENKVIFDCMKEYSDFNHEETYVL